MAIFSIKKRAFTLIELMIVISIIGILASISFIAYRNTTAKARDAVRKTTLASIRDALTMYAIENDSYPPSNGNDTIEALKDESITGQLLTAADILKTIPSDSDKYDDQYYNYLTNSANPSWYSISKKLELSDKYYMYSSSSGNTGLVDEEIDLDPEKDPPGINSDFSAWKDSNSAYAIAEGKQALTVTWHPVANPTNYPIRYGVWYRNAGSDDPYTKSVLSGENWATVTFNLNNDDNVEIQVHAYNMSGLETIGPSMTITGNQPIIIDLDMSQAEPTEVITVGNVTLGWEATATRRTPLVFVVSYRLNNWTVNSWKKDIVFPEELENGNFAGTISLSLPAGQYQYKVDAYTNYDRAVAIVSADPPKTFTIP